MKFIVALLCLGFACVESATLKKEARILNGEQGFKEWACVILGLQRIFPDEPESGLMATLSAGTIVSRRAILTSYSAIERAIEFQIGYGSGTAQQMARVRAVTSWAIRGADAQTFTNDIALIFLPDGVSLNINSPNVAVASLPAIPFTAPTSGIIASFGFTQPNPVPPAMSANMKVLAAFAVSTCNADVGAPDDHQCGGDATGALCLGDNGAGLVVEEAGVVDPEDPEDPEGLANEPVPTIYGVASIIAPECDGTTKSSIQMFTEEHVRDIQALLATPSVAMLVTV